MDAMIDVNQEYIREVECEYKGERYKVRDNGAVLRMAREGKPKRPKDDAWTFGDRIDRGYAWFCGEAVHRIVAVAFLGEPPTKQHVVDHIDTNRQNNRPENLRWLTKLENILLNPITKAKIEYWCGRVESFLADPSQLRGHEKEDANFAWMRAVSPREAQNTLANWVKILSKPRLENKSRKNAIEEWIFQQNFTYKNDVGFFEDLESIKTEEAPSPVAENQPVFSPKSVDDVTENLIEQPVTKKEFMTALLEICESEGWNCTKYYKTDSWKTDMLITIGSRRMAFSAFNSVKNAAKLLPIIERDGVKSYGLILSPKKDEILNFCCFSLHRNENVLEASLTKTKLPFDTFVKKAVEDKIVHLTKTKITDVDVIFEQIECWRCHKPHFVFYTRYLVDENGIRHDENDSDWEYSDDRNFNIPDLCFGDEMLELVKRYIAEHPEKNIIMGEVKERYSDTRKESYMSFGCPNCDAILGDWFLNDLEINLMYETDESRMNRIKLKTPFEMPVNDWIVVD